jgi:cation transport ATPase
MILPIFPPTQNWYERIDMFPEEWGVFSLVVIINIIITLYVMIFHARHFITRAFKSYVEYHETNMETLIALGSISAFALFLFFIVKYWIEYENTGAAAGKAIMDVN